MSDCAELRRLCRIERADGPPPSGSGVTPARAPGAALVVAGVALVALTRPSAAFTGAILRPPHFTSWTKWARCAHFF
jgi:hypothetical protein